MAQITRFVLRAVAAVILCLLIPNQVALLHAQSHEEAVLWESIKDSDHISDYQGYLDKYPNGTWATVAHRRIDELSAKNSAANSISVSMKHLCCGYFPGYREGTLTVSQSGITWKEPAHADAGFNIPCDQAVVSVEGGGFKFRIDRKSYQLDAVTDNQFDGRLLNKVKDALTQFCGLTL